MLSGLRIWKKEVGQSRQVEREQAELCVFLLYVPVHLS